MGAQNDREREIKDKWEQGNQGQMATQNNRERIRVRGRGPCGTYMHNVQFPRYIGVDGNIAVCS